MTDKLEERQLRSLVTKNKQLNHDLESYNKLYNNKKGYNLLTSQVPDFIYDFIVTKDYSNLETDIRDELTPDNYKEKLMTLLNLEQTFRAINLHHLLDQGEVELVAIDSGTLSMRRPRVNEANLRNGDMVILRKASSIAGIGEVKLEKDDIKIKRSRFSKNFPSQGGLFDVVWVIYDINFYRCLKAIREVEASSIQTALFPKLVLPRPISFDESNSDAMECILDDPIDHQKDAVRKITSDLARKAVYIIYGPPGTGKTCTLIELIVQVHQRHPESRLLVCAITNKCVDHLALKILDSGKIPEESIRRTTSDMRQATSNETLESRASRCGLNDNCDHDHMIVITTFGTAAKSTIKFDYALLDEAHRFSEPEALVILNKLSKTGRFVMAGDPQQPGPVCIYPVARDHGLGRSMLERLCQVPAYQGSPGSAICTKLTTCYRSDPRLMALNNELFYNNELKCLATTPQEYLGLLDANSPLIFEKIALATEQRDPRSLSWFNEKEVQICLRYIKLLHDNQIGIEKVGIISPYKAQVEKILEALEREQLPRCKVDSVKTFRGEERDIILISAVRTSVDPDCEFLFDPKHFNVASSRAKFVLIVIGHEETLKSSPCWTKYIERAESRTHHDELFADVEQ